eukprot:650735-Amphidinium_carterae.1
MCIRDRQRTSLQRETCGVQSALSSLGPSFCEPHGMSTCEVRLLHCVGGGKRSRECASQPSAAANSTFGTAASSGASGTSDFAVTLYV